MKWNDAIRCICCHEKQPDDQLEKSFAAAAELKQKNKERTLAYALKWQTAHRAWKAQWLLLAACLLSWPSRIVDAVLRLSFFDCFPAHCHLCMWTLQQREEEKKNTRKKENWEGKWSSASFVLFISKEISFRGMLKSFRHFSQCYLPPEFDALTPIQPKHLPHWKTFMGLHLTICDMTTITNETLSIVSTVIHKIIKKLTALTSPWDLIVRVIFLNSLFFAFLKLLHKFNWHKLKSMWFDVIILHWLCHEHCSSDDSGASHYPRAKSIEGVRHLTRWCCTFHFKYIRLLKCTNYVWRKSNHFARKRDYSDFLPWRYILFSKKYLIIIAILLLLLLIFLMGEAF